MALVWGVMKRFGACQSGFFRWKGFCLCHVEGGSAERSAAQGVNECGLVHQRPASYVDKSRARFHARKLCGAEQMFRFICLRSANNDVVRCGQCFVQFCCGDNSFRVSRVAGSGARYAQTRMAKALARFATSRPMEP